jgi:hypothetical protein
MFDDDVNQTHMTLATLFACTVRALEKSGKISGDDWIAELTKAYTTLRGRDGDDLRTMETLSLTTQVFKELRSS